MMLGDDSDSEVKLEINKNYADRYNTWRQKEELQKLKDRYGEAKIQNIHSSSDDSSSSEDENAEQLTQQFEIDFFKTLSCLKKKDPSIYDKKVLFFYKNSKLAAQKETANGKKNTNKPLFLRDYERKLIEEHEGKFSESEEESNKNIEKRHSPTIAEEENLIKQSFKGALKDSDNEDDEAWGGLFQKRHKTEEEVKKEEEDYREWLKGQKDELLDKKTELELKYLHDYWNDPKLNSDESFLKDYILNKRFLETNDDDDYIPTYDEIVHDSDDNLSEDEKTIEKQEEFEHKFNFRFEEPDKEFIKRYPRTMENSLRKKDDRRKRKRQEVKERKEADEARKREELKRLKALKRKEIIQKIEKLKQITGNSEIGFKDEDLEGDFNPAVHDRRMNQLFNSDFYDGEESIKPVFPELDEELEIENWNTWNGESFEMGSEQVEHEPHCEDPDFNMDCDYNSTDELQNELIQSTKRKKKGKKWSKFAQSIARKKPVFDSKNHTFDEYIDEYYKLDFEDLIGDMPCRFKYRSVVPNTFGLSIDEILGADDKELNKWCSLKKAVQHRPEHIEKYDVHAYERKAMNANLKKKIFHSLYSEEPLEQLTENEDTKNKKRKQKKLETTCSDEFLQQNSDNSKKIKLSNCVKQSNEKSENVNADFKGEELNLSDKEELNSLPVAESSQSSRIQKKKKKKKKKKDKLKRSSTPSFIPSAGIHAKLKSHKNEKITSKKSWRKSNKQSDRFESQEFAISNARLRAYGINPKKFKNKLKYGNK